MPTRTEAHTERKANLLDLSQAQLAGLLTSLGEPPFRTRQLWRWLYRGLAGSPEAMTDLPQGLRDHLASRAEIGLPVPVKELVSGDAQTRKALLRLNDGKLIEAVLMLYDPSDGSRGRATVCVSTQVGCAVGCPFCATGQMGLVRNLTPGEIVAQVLHFARWLRFQNGRASLLDGPPSQVTNVVFMGMGEPLLNYSNTWQALEALNSPDGFGLAARRMTLSTAGHAPGIRRLAAEALQVNLAVSLHAPNDPLRDTLVPINRKYPIAALLDACRLYIERTGRRITFEYVLLERVNDSLNLAQELGLLLRGMPCHVNLIPVNPTPSPYARPSRQRVLAFQRVVESYGIATTVRVEKGVDIRAACGQLATEARGSSPRLHPAPATRG